MEDNLLMQKQLSAILSTLHHVCFREIPMHVDKAHTLIQ